MLSSINGPLTSNSATALNPVGGEYEVLDSTGLKKYIYLQEDGGVTVGCVRVISENGLKAEDVATASLARMPIVALTTVTDTYYGWYQFEGYCATTKVNAGTSVGLASNLATNHYLVLYAASQALRPNSGVGGAYRGWALLLTSWPQATADATYVETALCVYLSGEKGSATDLS